MSLDLVKQIREKTGLPLGHIKKVVEANSSSSVEELIEILRKEGVLKQKDRTNRSTHQGYIFSYVHEGRVGVMLELRCETDFVARSDDFQGLGHDICLHIAAYQPTFVSKDQVDPSFIEKELEIARSQLLQEGKPENILDKILEGKKKKLGEENSLLSQNFLKDPSITVGDQILNVGRTTGENIEVQRFIIYTL